MTYMDFRTKPIWRDNQVYYKLLPSSERSGLRLNEQYICTRYKYYAERFIDDHWIGWRKRYKRRRWCSLYLDRKFRREL